MGTIPSPFDRWFAHRRVKALHLWALAASRTVSILAKTLDSLLIIQVILVTRSAELRSSSIAMAWVVG